MKQDTTSEVKVNGVIVDLAVLSHPTIETKAQEQFLQVGQMEKNAHQNNFSVVKNLPKTPMVESVFQNDGSVIIIGIVRMGRTKSIVLHPNVTQGNGHAVLTSSTTQIAFQVIIVVIRQLIVMTSQMNKIATIVRAKRVITNAVVVFA
jgi:hypothetical protein